MRALAVALLALAACAPEAVESVTLTPTSPEIEDVLRAADARWEAAGVDPDRIVIAEGGAPVRYTPEHAPVSETRIVKRGFSFAGVRFVDLAALDVDVATHELGHALGVDWATPESHHLVGAECDLPALERPTLCASAGSVITAEDLAAVCAVGACRWFTPER